MTVPCCSDSDSSCSDSDSPSHASEPSFYMSPTSRQPRSSSACSSQQLPAPGSPAYWASCYNPLSSSAHSWKRADCTRNQPETAWHNTGVPLPLSEAAPNDAAKASTPMRIENMRALLAMKAPPTAARAIPKRTPSAVLSGAATNTAAATATSSAAADTAQQTPSCAMQRPQTVVPRGGATTLGVVYILPKQRPSRTIQLPSANVPSAAAHILALDPPLSPSAKRLQRGRHLLGPPPNAAATSNTAAARPKPSCTPPTAVPSTALAVLGVGAAAHTDGHAAATSNADAARPKPSCTPPTAVPSTARAVFGVAPRPMIAARMCAEWLGSPPVPVPTTPLELAPCGRPRTDAHSAAAPTTCDATATSIAAAETALKGPLRPRPPDHPPSLLAIAELECNRFPFSKARAGWHDQRAFCKAGATSSRCRSRSRSRSSSSRTTLVMGGFEEGL
jgi:hypothetical protein